MYMENEIQLPCNFIHESTATTPEHLFAPCSNNTLMPLTSLCQYYHVRVPAALSDTANTSKFPCSMPTSSAVSTPFGTLHEEMTAQEMMDAKALAASKSHSEAERRRRERINAHLSKLRSMLPNSTKTDKASLLAEVIQHVKELKRQTSELAEANPVPSEADELIVNPICDDKDGDLIVRAALCCDDRSDLLPDLINALKELKLRTLKAEIATVGRRVTNVLLIAGVNNSSDEDKKQSLTLIEDALRAVVQQPRKHDTCNSLAAGGAKRQRTNSLCLGKDMH